MAEGRGQKSCSGLWLWSESQECRKGLPCPPSPTPAPLGATGRVGRQAAVVA